MSAGAKGITIVGASAGSGKTYRLTGGRLGGDPSDERAAHRSRGARRRHVHAQGARRARGAHPPHARRRRGVRRGAAPAARVPRHGARGLSSAASGVRDRRGALAERRRASRRTRAKLLRQSLEASLEPEALRERSNAWRCASSSMGREDQAHGLAHAGRRHHGPRAEQPDRAFAARGHGGAIGGGPDRAPPDAGGERRRRHRSRARRGAREREQGAGEANDGVGRHEGVRSSSSRCATAMVSRRRSRLVHVGEARARRGEQGLRPALVEAARDGVAVRGASAAPCGDARADARDLRRGARGALVRTQTWKERRRVVDYVDMLGRALELVSHPRVERELARSPEARGGRRVPGHEPDPARALREAARRSRSARCGWAIASSASSSMRAPIRC